MLNIRTSSNTSCANITELLSEIDGKLFYYGKNHWNNISLLLNLNYDKVAINKLLHYKRILTKRLYNPNYACNVELNQIISQIKTYLNK